MRVGWSSSACTGWRDDPPARTVILLAIDTSAASCAACLYDTAAGRELAREVLEIGKGHAEHLLGVIERTLSLAGRDFPDIDRIVVGIGPGSFTGIRVGVSAARGLSLALGVPAVGVASLEALAAEALPLSGGAPVLVALDAGRGGIHAAIYRSGGNELAGPWLSSPADAARAARRYDAVLAGSAAAVVAAEADGALTIGAMAAAADIATYARLGGARASGRRPAPLYLRGADAKPQAGFVLPRKGA